MFNRWRYRLHGFVLESEIELPALISDEAANARIDVRLRIGRVPRSLPGAVECGACYAAAPGQMLCWLPGTARFHIVAGNEIVVAPEADAAVETIRNLVLSSPLAALLLQRRLLPLHASAVATPAGAVIIAGGAAVGKSTVAAALQRRGLAPLSDDLTVVSTGPDGPAVQPGYPALRLWPDAMSAVPRNATGAPVRPGVAKRLVVGTRTIPTSAQRLAAVFVIDRHEMPSNGDPCRRLSGAETVRALFEVVYRIGFVRGMALDRWLFGQVSAMAREVPVVRLFNPPDRFTPDEVARHACQWLPL